MDRYEDLREQVLPVLLPYGVEEIALFGSVAQGKRRPKVISTSSCVSPSRRGSRSA